jgi:uncharacterized protein YkwD
MCAVVAAVVLLLSGCMNDSEKAMFDRLNQVRAQNGLPALVEDEEATQKAQDHALQMAQQAGIFHSADLGSGYTGRWRLVGENVAMGPTVDSALSALLNSAPHMHNILDPTFNGGGIGIVQAPDGWVYIVQEFVAR